MPKAYAYLASLSDAQLLSLEWIADHPPKSRSRDQLPPYQPLLAAWDKARPKTATIKVFPTYRRYKFACSKLGLHPRPKWKRGIPPSISSDFISHPPPRSVITVYTCLYKHSRYDPAWNMRVAETSRNGMVQRTRLAPATIDRAMSFLRAHRYILRIWRGRPNPRNERYRHSAYELPYDLDHVLYWRIHGGRKAKIPPTFS